MTSVLEKMLAETNTSMAQLNVDQAKPLRANGLARSKRAVDDSAELRRILALPRRQWETQAAAYADKVTAYLRAPGGTQKLRPIQAAALVEMHDNRGLLMSASVGSGKTIVSLLGFLVLESKRPLLLVPAKLKEKTYKEMMRYRQHWLIPGYVRIESYEKLGRAQHVNLLEEAQPDVIICDEVHKLRSSSAAVSKRVRRFLAANPHTIFVGMSGTVTKRSLHDYAHLAGWALRERSPAPLHYEERMAWSLALDEKRDNDQRLAPGALVQMCTPEERAALVRTTDIVEATMTVRKAYRRRLTDTPGIVASQYTPGQVGASLRIENVRLPVTGKAFQTALASLRERWERPDGEPIMDAIELWRHLREVGCGFYYRWRPAPPQDWRTARRNWAAFVREVLKTNRSNIDSESQVAKAVDDKHYDSRWLDAWRKVKDTFIPKTEAVWLDEGVVDFCCAWLKGEAKEVQQEDQGGIVWVEHTEFGHRLAQKSGIPYYHRKGQNEKGQAIEAHPPGKPLIASIASNSEGRNLQGWSRGLIVSPPQSGATWEQTLGRSHREGQEADEVVMQFITTIPEQLASFDRARADARYISDTTGQEQKLCYADVVIDEFGGSAKTPRK